MSDKPKGYFDKFLVIDTETSGIITNGHNVAYDYKTKQYCQAVSVGAIVVDSRTLNSIEELYVEIQWDGKSMWNDRAQQVHGLTREYLKEHGVSRTEAVEQLGNLILSYFGPDTAIVLAGHNTQFDLCFLRELMESEGLHLRFSNRIIDTNTIGFSVFGTYNSDDLFDLVSPKRDPNKHNALHDARSVLKVLKMTKQLMSHLEG